MTTFAGLETIEVDKVQTDWGRWMIHGPQGTGKTTLASTIAQFGKVLFVDCVGEKGVRSFQGAKYAKNIDVIRPTSITQFDDIYYELADGDHEYIAVIIDSITSVQKMAMRFLMEHNETAVREITRGSEGATMRIWGRSLEIMQDTATYWYGLADGNREFPMHVIMTAQTKIVESEDTGDLTRIPDVQKGALSIVLAAPDYVLYTDVEQNMEALGDDTLPPMNHIVRFGANSEYRTKARVPMDLRGTIPAIIGRDEAPDLARLSRELRIGGAPEAKPAAKKTNTNTTKES